MASINVWIDEQTGDPIIEGEGFDGMDCEAVMKELENLLGETESRTLKPGRERMSRRQSRDATT